MTDVSFRSTLKTGLCCLLCLGILWAFPGQIQAARHTVAVLPFTINGPAKYRYLRQGIADMLSSRLYEQDAIAITGEQKVNELAAEAGQEIDADLAKQIGIRIGADHVALGTVTIVGQSMSLDAQIIPTADEAEPFRFSRNSEKLDSLITDIDTLAREFKAELLGSSEKAAARPKASTDDTVASSAAESTQKAGEDFFQPEGSQSPFIQMLEQQQKNRVFWRSQSYDLLINGLDLADVDQDGRQELVFASKEKVHVLRAEDNLLSPVQAIPTSSGRLNIGLDVADINRNGYPEIFVTCLGEQKERIKSCVLEYDGTKFKTILRDSPWLFRVAKQPHGQALLLGQKQRALKEISGEIFQLKADKGGYSPDFRILPDKGVNLLGVGYGYVTKTADKELVAYDQRNRLKIFDASEQDIWTSEDKFGGNSLFISQSRPEPGEPEERAYLPVRVRIADIDDNGQSEVVTIKNQELVGGHLKRFRHYGKGRIVSLSWDGVGLARDWTTRELSGQVRDFCFGDLNNDGTKELVAVLVKDEGRVILQDAKSLIISYTLQPLQEKK